MYIYNILFGLKPTALHIQLKGSTYTGRTTYCHAFCVEEINGRIDQRRFFLYFGVARVWNCFAANAPDFRTIQAFKESLNKIDFSSPLTIQKLTAIIIINNNIAILYEC